MNALMKTSGTSNPKEEDRLKSVPPPAVKAALAALRIYKVYLSAHMPGGCRFDPTCSMYAYQAIERFGVMRGTWLGLKRLLRCHPLSRKFGYDPVPENVEAEAQKADESGQDTGRRGATPREAHS
ncbi:MAG: membrane protein insertion efficiency factor YidD [Candidatus Acidiferrum sp.]